MDIIGFIIIVVLIGIMIAMSTGKLIGNDKFPDVSPLDDREGIMKWSRRRKKK